MTIYSKQPDGRLAYSIDWPGVRGAIRDSAWRVQPEEAGGVTIGGVLAEVGRTGALIDGGVAGRRYRISHEVIFADGQRERRALTLEIGR